MVDFFGTRIYYNTIQQVNIGVQTNAKSTRNNRN